MTKVISDRHFSQRLKMISIFGRSYKSRMVLGEKKFLKGGTVEIIKIGGREFEAVPFLKEGETALWLPRSRAAELGAVLPVEVARRLRGISPEGKLRTLIEWRDGGFSAILFDIRDGTDRIRAVTGRTVTRDRLLRPAPATPADMEEWFSHFLRMVGAE